MVENTKQMIIMTLDRYILRFETGLSILCVGGIFVLMLANVVLRNFGAPLMWGDELAVNLMVWAAFLGCSMAIATRQQVAVDLLADRLDARGRIWLSFGVNCVTFVAIFIVSWLVWRWFDPLRVIQADSISAFSAVTYNFIYQEPTLMLGWPKAVLWGIVPFFCFTTAFHTLVAIHADILRLGQGRSA